MYEFPNWLLSLVTGLLTIYSIGIGWIVNRVFKLLDDLKEEDKQLRHHVESHFVKHEEIDNLRAEMKDGHNRIEDKIDRVRDYLMTHSTSNKEK